MSTSENHPHFTPKKLIGFAIFVVIGINSSILGGHLSGRKETNITHEHLKLNAESTQRRLEIDNVGSNEHFHYLNEQTKILNIRRRLQEGDFEVSDLSDAVGSEALEPEPQPFVSRESYLGLVFPEPEKMPVYLRNTMMPLDSNDLIFFWSIPKTGGSLMKTILGTCFGFRRAEKLKNPPSMEMVKDTVLNVDTATPAGIEVAQSLNIADAGMLDIIISPFVLSASSLFTEYHHGRAFTLLRHPVDTAASNFFSRKASNKHFRKLGLTLVDYVAQDWYPDNWMVRQLTGVLPGLELTQHHLDLAKHLLSAKFFIGITEQLEETMRQLRVYYGWTELPGREGCALSYIRGMDPTFTPTSRPKPKRGSDGWFLILEREKWDLELYYFGLQMFSRQAIMYPSVVQVEAEQDAVAEE